MATTTKKELTNVIAQRLNLRQMIVRDVVQTFLDLCVEELRAGHRLEFRDFGVFETVPRAARKARNPKTGDVVQVPPKTVVDFKMGKRMKGLVNLPVEPPAAPAPPAAPPSPPPPQP
jgi:integration host factor subunit beta